METSLTKSQQEVLAFLHKYHDEEGVMPTTREIQRHLGFSSQTSAMSHLRVLERKGEIQRLPGLPRAIVFTEDLNRGPMLRIPIYGQIPATGRSRRAWRRTGGRSRPGPSPLTPQAWG